MTNHLLYCSSLAAKINSKLFLVFANWIEKRINSVSADYLCAFQKVFYESLTIISPGKVKSFAN